MIKVVHKNVSLGDNLLISKKITNHNKTEQIIHNFMKNLSLQYVSIHRNFHQIRLMND